MSIPTELATLAANWLKWDPNPETKKQVQDWVDAANVEALQKNMANRIDFGTAGFTGTTIALISFQLTLKGLALYLEKTVPEAKARGVAIGYDGRFNSLTFAKYTAATFLHLGFNVFFFPTIVPTPLTSFAVLGENCVASVMITASHNPKDDNGYKVYWENSAQINSPHDKGIRECIHANQDPWGVDPESVFKHPQFHQVGQDLWEKYWSTIKPWNFYHGQYSQSPFKIVYTAMHGVGYVAAKEAFVRFGLPAFIPTPEQVEPDPNFPTVAFPNPEEGKGALKLAMEAADKSGATLILANDPDADRLAAAEKLPSGEWKVFTGNEIGVLLAYWVLTEYKKRHTEVKDWSKYLMVNTTVSSKMIQSLCHKEGLTYEETLTGFKWIGNRADELRAQGYTFLFGFEEAIGYMVGDACLDKDGIRGAAAFGEMATHWHTTQQLTCTQMLAKLSAEYGTYVTNNRYFFCYDPVKLVSIFNVMRNGGKYHTHVGKYKVSRVRDLTTPGYDSATSDNKPTFPVSSGTQMITYFFDEVNAIATLRGSGTEPKLKYYVEMNNGGDASKDRDSIKAELDALLEAIIDQLLQPSHNGLEKPKD